MTGLVLKLSPRERLLFNGAVLQNGERGAKIYVRSPNANILRLKDAIHPSAVRSTIDRIAYICQLVLSGDADKRQAQLQATIGLQQIRSETSDVESHNIIQEIQEMIDEFDFYAALRRARVFKLVDGMIVVDC